MKTRIYNNLLFSLLFVCSFCGLFGAELFAQQPPTTTATSNVERGEPTTLHLYSTIFGEEKKIKASSSDREAVNRTIQRFFGRFFSIIFTVSGMLMVMLLAVHGTKMVYAEFGGNVSAFGDAKSKVKAAAIGTGILLLSWVILNFIDPALLRPKLFETITGLQEVGSGSELFSNDLEIPKGSITFDQQTGTLTITRCPQAETDFEKQAEEIRILAQHNTMSIPLRHAYQILYTRPNGEVYLHNTAGNDKPYERSGDERISHSLIVCNENAQTGKEGKPPIGMPPITVTLTEAGTIAVFPVMYIEVEEEVPIPNTSPPKTKKEIKQKKFWRGVPWKYNPDSDFDYCTSLGKANITTTDITALNVSSNPDESYKSAITFPSISTILPSDGTIITGYHISTKDVKYCTVKTTDGCTGGGRSFASATNKNKIEFVIDENTAGTRLVEIDSNVDTFQITPIIDSEKGFQGCKGPLRGKTACFEVLRVGGRGGKIFSVIPQSRCVDENISRASGAYKKSLQEQIKSTIVYPATFSSVRASNTFDGYSFIDIDFEIFNSENNLKNIEEIKETYGADPFKDNTGRGRGLFAKFKIVEGNVSFKHATQDRVVGITSRNINGWKRNKEYNKEHGLTVYFRGDPTHFCISPTIGEYELTKQCYTPPSDN
ncbi:MAG: pilin [Candidatus Kaiserbacteria bacterium]|nr:pilin [Candidatus Kaiserbacteria bacterium]